MERNAAVSAVPRTLLRRLSIYLLGNFVLALGVVISVKSRLGVSPVQSIPYAVSRLYGFDQGVVTMVVYSSFVLLQVPILRGAFRARSLLQVLIAVLFGFFVMICGQLVTFAPPEAYYARALLAFVSVIFVALGLFFYLAAELIPQPAEGLLLALQYRSGWQLHDLKIASDCAMVAAAALFSYIASGEVTGVREGTFLSMICVGKMLGLFTKLWRTKLRAFCFSE